MVFDNNASLRYSDLSPFYLFSQFATALPLGVLAHLFVSCSVRKSGVDPVEKLPRKRSLGFCHLCIFLTLVTELSHESFPSLNEGVLHGDGWMSRTSVLLSAVTVQYFALWNQGLMESKDTYIFMTYFIHIPEVLLFIMPKGSATLAKANV